MRTVLDSLLTNEFEDAIFGVASPSALRVVLAKSREVKEIRTAAFCGSLGEDEIERFIDTLLLDFRRGERFRGDLALAALAVVLETVPSSFAEVFLKDLSGLRIREMPMATRVATVALAVRSRRLANSSVKVYRLDVPPEPSRDVRVADQLEPVSTSSTDYHFVDLGRAA